MRREFSAQTKREAWERSEGLCEGIRPDGERCCANLRHKPYHFDHIIPDAIGHDNSLQNCAVLCVPCHEHKTRKIDVPMIAKAKRVSDRHLGIKRKGSIRSAGFPKRKPQRTASRPIERWAP